MPLRVPGSGQQRVLKGLKGCALEDRGCDPSFTDGNQALGREVACSEPLGGAPSRTRTRQDQSPATPVQPRARPTSLSTTPAPSGPLCKNNEEHF